MPNDDQNAENAAKTCEVGMILGLCAHQDKSARFVVEMIKRGLTPEEVLALLLSEVGETPDSALAKAQPASLEVQ